jgi:hypothetical protein
MANATKCPSCETLHPGPRPDLEIAEALREAVRSALRSSTRDGLMLLAANARLISAELEHNCGVCQLARALRTAVEDARLSEGEPVLKLRLVGSVSGDGFETAEIGVVS